MKVFQYPSRVGIRVKLVLGEKQVNIFRASASHDLRRYLEPSNNSEIGIMSYNFPSNEWGNSEWISWLRNIQKRGVLIKVVGGPKIKAEKQLEELVKEGVVIARKLDKPELFHVIYATEPKQLWVEQYHKRGHAFSCHYTRFPYEDVWNGMVAIFNKVWEMGTPLTYTPLLSK